MRRLELLVIHCTATPAGREVTPADIRRWHTSPAPAGRGWSRVGYSRLIGLDGTSHLLHSYNEDAWVQAGEVTNGAAGFNANARHICYAGGCDAQMRPSDTRTPAQRAELERYVKAMLRLHPNIRVAGHNQLSAKACPSFDTVAWLRSIGIPEKNIYKK